MKRFKFYTAASLIQHQIWSLFNISVEIDDQHIYKHYNSFVFKLSFISSDLLDYLSKYRSKGYYVAITPAVGCSLFLFIDTPYKN